MYYVGYLVMYGKLVKILVTISVVPISLVKANMVCWVPGHVWDVGYLVLAIVVEPGFAHPAAMHTPLNLQPQIKKTENSQT